MCLLGSYWSVSERSKDTLLGILDYKKVQFMFGILNIRKLNAIITMKCPAWGSLNKPLSPSSKKQLLNHLLGIVEKKHGFAKLASILEQKNGEGQGLLHLAVLGSHLSIVKMLLERGCDVESTMDGEETVLHIAAVSGVVEMVELILKFMPVNGIDQANDNGRTSLHKCARFGKHRIVSMLLKRFVRLSTVLYDLLKHFSLSSHRSTHKLFNEFFS